MIWKEFKDRVEEQGVEDYTEIVEIRWRKGDDPEVKTHAVVIQ